MDNKLMYEMIFKRKSFHLFKDVGDEKLTKEEIDDIYRFFHKTKRLNDINVKINITNKSPICKRGQEFIIVFYSEKKENYLQNIGYIGEQIDLYLASKNIGALWYGIDRVARPKYEGLDFVIIMAIKKIDDPSKFREDMFKAKRKELSEIWKGEYLKEVGDIARFAPSACNSQPWIVSANENELTVSRIKDLSKRGIMPPNMMRFFNQIDIGIFLLFLEVCLEHNNVNFERTVFEETDHNAELNLTAKYLLK